MFGVSADYFDSMGLNNRRGRIFDDFDNKHMNLVAVMGYKLAKRMFGNDHPIAENIYLSLNSKLFVVRVAGELKEKGGTLGDLVDNALFLPQQTLQKLVAKQSLSTVILGTLVDENNSNLAKTETLALLGRSFKGGLVVNDAREAIERTKDIWDKQNLVGICLALISLLTGGTGIMNVMLLSINQRKREIGIRKAVGAPDRAIFSQFLFESVLVCFLGGVIGVLVGVLFGQQVANLMGQWEAAISMGAVGLALGSACGIGIVFGLLPAKRASRLDPFEALRS
jgi:putative ABC transport system permease protein